MRRWIGIGLIVLALPSWAAAGEARAQLTVTARVVPRVTLQPVVEPAQFTVVAADIERGYVDVGAIFRVANNDPAGYVLRLAPRVGMTRAIEVTGLASRVLVADDVVEVSQPAALRPQELRLSFRLLLDGSVGPGTYEVPVHVAARAF